MSFINADLSPRILPFANARFWAKPITLSRDRLIDNIDPANVLSIGISLANTTHVLFQILEQLLGLAVIFFGPSRTLRTDASVKPHDIPTLFTTINPKIGLLPIPLSRLRMHSSLLKSIRWCDELKFTIQNRFS